METLDTLLFSRELSAKALKVLLYIMRVNEIGNTEKFTQKEIRKAFKEGRDSIRNAIKELEEKGFITKEQTRVETGSGEIFGANDFRIVKNKLLQYSNWA